MKLKESALGLLVGLSLPSGAAVASTIPPVDFHRGERHLAIGLLDGSLDYAVSDGLSLGVSGALPVLPKSPSGIDTFGFAAVRATLRLLDLPERLALGLTLSAGVFGSSVMPASNAPEAGAVPSTYNWLQPAVNVAVPFDRFTIRGTIGPLLTSFIPYEPLFRWTWPNLEFSYRLNESNEFTVGGNSLVGWRGTLPKI